MGTTMNEQIETSVLTPIRITETWVEIEIISEPDIYITARGYVPVVRVKADGHKIPRLLIISAKSIALPMEEMRQDNSGQFLGLRFSLRKAGPLPKDKYELQ